MRDKPAGSCAWQDCPNSGTHPVGLNASLRTWLEEPWHSVSIQTGGRDDPLAPTHSPARRLVMLCEQHAEQARPLLELSDESEE
jgi:hypothetical protein